MVLDFCIFKKVTAWVIFLFCSGSREILRKVLLDYDQQMYHMQTYSHTHTTQHLQDTQLLIIWIILDSLLSELKRRNAEVTGFDFQVILFHQCGIKIQLKWIENTWTQLSVKPTTWRWFGPAVHEKWSSFSQWLKGVAHRLISNSPDHTLKIRYRIDSVHLVANFMVTMLCIFPACLFSVWLLGNSCWPAL